MNRRLIISIFGWYGTAAIVLAYTLSSFKVISSDTIIYQLLNLTGALGIIFSSLEKRNYQPAVLNIVWFAVALISIVKIFFP